MNSNVCYSDRAETCFLSIFFLHFSQHAYGSISRWQMVSCHFHPMQVPIFTIIAYRCLIWMFLYDISSKCVMNFDRKKIENTFPLNSLSIGLAQQASLHTTHTCIHINLGSFFHDKLMLLIGHAMACVTTDFVAWCEHGCLVSRTNKPHIAAVAKQQRKIWLLFVSFSSRKSCFSYCIILYDPHVVSKMKLHTPSDYSPFIDAVAE